MGKKRRERKNPKRDRRPSKTKRDDSKLHASHRRPERQKKEKQRFQVIRIKATVDKNRKGFAFLVFENREYEDAFVSPRDAEGLFHGDRVEAFVNHAGRIESIRVIEHRFREVVGRFTPNPAGRGKGGWVVYERKKAREEIYVPQHSGVIKAEDWVRAKLTFHNKGPYSVTAEIVEVFGKDLPPSADLPMVAAEYNLIEEHSKEAEAEAKSLTLEIPGRDLKGRQDLRKVPFITIDGETARDFDDAVYVERNKSGFRLWVAIADVSHYVRENSHLDQEARSRGTSVYFPERAFHMLPRALSENLCSLRPHEPRLSLVAVMDFDRRANRIKTEVMEAVIESQRRATYTEIQREWESHQKDTSWEYAPHFELYQALKEMRKNRGSIDFELPEAEVLVDPTGDVISIKNRPRFDAHRLIEEFMIAANEAETDWMIQRSWPFVYRIHEEPSAQSLEKFKSLAETVGVKVVLEEDAGPKVVADIVRRLEGHPTQLLLNMALLRSMKQAIYSSTHDIHYGLASPGYTHFTSPIRRYPDLVVHRLLRMVLRKGAKGDPTLDPHSRTRLEKDLADVCEHCSYRERLAADAERESIKLKQVRAVAKHLGDEFSGKIVGMVASGLFVQIDDPYAEGLVSTESMTDDFYQFDEDRMVFVGKRKRRIFKIGDFVKVRAVSADIDKRQIDFSMLD